jgi:hypothetical protein
LNGEYTEMSFKEASTNLGLEILVIELSFSSQFCISNALAAFIGKRRPQYGYCPILRMSFNGASRILLFASWVI